MLTVEEARRLPDDEACQDDTLTAKTADLDFDWLCDRSSSHGGTASWTPDAPTRRIATHSSGQSKSERRVAPTSATTRCALWKSSKQCSTERLEQRAAFAMTDPLGYANLA